MNEIRLVHLQYDATITALVYAVPYAPAWSAG